MSEHLSTSGASTRRLAKTRGAASGLLLVALGAWGALVPFVGPWFNFAYSPDESWHWTAARGWLEVLPGVVTLLGGLLLLMSSSRITTSLGAWLGIAGGAWFVVGPQLAAPLHLGAVGGPTGSSSGLRALESLAYFYALGAVILFLAAAAFGRLSVVTVRDVRVAERREAARIEAEETAAREAAAREAAEREAAQREAAQRDAAQREAAQRDAAQREAAAREPAGGSGSDWEQRRSADAQDSAQRQQQSQDWPYPTEPSGHAGQTTSSASQQPADPAAPTR